MGSLRYCCSFQYFACAHSLRLWLQHQIVGPVCRRTALKEAFTALMMANSAEVAAAVARLTARLRQQRDAEIPLTPTEELALRLNSQYPDVSIAF